MNHIAGDRIPPPENVGGAGKAAWNLAVGLQHAGHDVRVIAATDDQPFEEAR
jgi:nucleoside-diphosphate-sugar epimerase